ncbi:MAG TPA: GNAT family N-acetyltransferase, partial [Chitinophagaceae bacterium]|nr:GNAT family N-acetyltransferase [Chitinophagaceae bacterium]
MTTIREATINDINELAVLFDAYRNFYKKNADIEKAKMFLTARIENEESVIFVADDNENKLTGFVQLYPLFSSTRMQRLWLLNDLYVAENFRGKGISVALINKAKEHCKETGACGLMLETAKDNDIGNQLYPKTNFGLDNDHNYYF